MNYEDILLKNAGERHLPVVLLVDTSGSMAGKGINELNEGLRHFGKSLNEDSLALGRAEIAIVSFSTGVDIIQAFSPASLYEAPLLRAGGMTCLNEGIMVALDLIEDRKAIYRSAGVSYYRPILVLITDGYATDASNVEAQRRLKKYIHEHKVNFIPFAINGSDTKNLLEYFPDDGTKRIVLSVRDYNFQEVFVWLSQSISLISSSNPEISDSVTLPDLPCGITVGI